MPISFIKVLFNFSDVDQIFLESSSGGMPALLLANTSGNVSAFLPLKGICGKERIVASLKGISFVPRADLLFDFPSVHGSPVRIFERIVALESLYIPLES